MDSDATRVPAGLFLSRFSGFVCNQTRILGHARFIARPPYEQLLMAEGALRRAIPILILLFLGILAFSRMFALMVEREAIEFDAVADLGITASLLRAEAEAADVETAGTADLVGLLTSAVPASFLGEGRIAFITTPSGVVIGTLPGQDALIGRNVGDLLLDAQPLLLFGERAGVQRTEFEQEPAMVASAILGDGRGAVMLVQRESDLFAAWRGQVSLNVTMFTLTSGIMLVLLLAYFRQSTRARDADALYLRAHQRVDTALSRGHCGLWDWDLASGRVYWSRSMYEMLGMRPRDGVLSFGDIAPMLHPEDGDLFKVARIAASGRLKQLDHCFRMRRADGDYVWLRAKAELVTNPGDDVHLIGVAVDVSEQQVLARRTQVANNRLKNAVESISETFVLWDAEGRLVLCNSKYQQVFGLSEGDVLPGTPHEMIRARARKPIQDRPITSTVFVEGESARETMLADGRWFLFSERRTDDCGYVSIGTDVTQLKVHQARSADSERRLIATIEDLTSARRDAIAKARQLSELNLRFAAEKDKAETASRAKTTFLANMSHELRTPLNAIIGFSEIMRDGSFGPIGNAKYTEYAADIHKSGHYLLRLIDDILDMAKIEAGRRAVSPEPVDLCELLSESGRIVAVAAEQRGIELSVETPDVLDIVGDRRATKQVLLNILANAVKFASDEGRVRLRAHRAGSRAIVTVGDDGIGIPAEALKNLGRPFEQVENELTRTNKGTGLGLAIARSLVELHGGRMRIMSKVGRGTVVAFSLPVEPTSSPATREAEARSLSPARSAQNAACALAA